MMNIVYVHGACLFFFKVLLEFRIGIGLGVIVIVIVLVLPWPASWLWLEKSVLIARIRIVK
jgi:hypothetical protein